MEQKDTVVYFGMAASIVVIISFFLPWVKTWFISQSGFDLMSHASDLSGYFNGKEHDGLLFAIFVVLSPTACHVLNLIFLANQSKEFSLTATFAPIAIWVLVWVAIKAKTDSPNIAMFVSTNQPGLLGTIGGMIAGFVCSFIFYQTPDVSGLKRRTSVPMTTICPKCHQQFNGDLSGQFCDNCGSLFNGSDALVTYHNRSNSEETIIACGSCGHVCQESNAGQFCEECGAPLKHRNYS